MNLRTKFLNYTDTFITGDAGRDENVLLKKRHSLNVNQLARELCEAEGFAPHICEIADTASLLHDLGRFEQLRQYNTFADAQSFDHGEVGAQNVRRLGFLDGMPEEDAKAVTEAIRHHNDLALPESLSETERFITNIVRDADKIDIVETVLTYHINQLDNPQVTLGLSGERRLSPGVVAKAVAGEPIDYRELCTFYDFAAVKLSWFAGLNFQWSRDEFLRRGYADRIRAFLGGIPGTAEVFTAFAKMTGGAYVYR